MGGARVKAPRSQRWLKASAVGIEMAIAVVLGLVAGGWADEKLGTEPWLALVGLLLGFGVGFKAVMAVARVDDDEEEGT